MSRRKKSIVQSAKNFQNLKMLKHHIYFYKTLVISIIWSKHIIMHKRIFKEEESIWILKNWWNKKLSYKRNKP